MPKWEPEETTGIDTSLKHQEGTRTMKCASVDVYTGVSYGCTGCAYHPLLAVNQKIRNLTLYPRVSNFELGSSCWIPLLKTICMHLFLDNCCKHQSHIRHDRTQSIILQQSPNPNNLALLLLKLFQFCEVRVVLVFSEQFYKQNFTRGCLRSKCLKAYLAIKIVH